MSGFGMEPEPENEETGFHERPEQDEREWRCAYCERLMDGPMGVSAEWSGRPCCSWECASMMQQLDADRHLGDCNEYGDEP